MESFREGLDRKSIGVRSRLTRSFEVLNSSVQLRRRGIDECGFRWLRWSVRGNESSLFCVLLCSESHTWSTFPQAEPSRKRTKCPTHNTSRCLSLPLCISSFFGRTVQVNDQQGPRWSDLRLTREESIQAEKQFAIFTGQSLDANRVTIIDDVKVSSKNKGEFFWSEKFESVATNSLPVINGYLHSFRQTTDEKDLAPLSLSDQLQGSSRELLKEFFFSECE